MPRTALARLVGPLVSLAISRQVLVPIFLGADPETRRLAALDAAGFSAAIPGVLSYDLTQGDAESERIPGADLRPATRSRRSWTGRSRR